jgi:hypothetical protein
MDLFFLLLVGVFFFGSALLVRGCQRLRGLR